LAIGVVMVFLDFGASGAVAQPAYAVTDLGLFPTGTISKAWGINELGHVVGEADKNAAFYGQAVLWIDGEMLDLTGLGISGAIGHSVNDADQVVGFTDEFNLNAFLWADGELTELPVPVSCCSVAHDINAGGQIVGQSRVEEFGSTHAVLWEDGVMTDLGTLGGNSSYAYAINDAGQIVGSATTGDSTTRAFLWQDNVMVDLGTLGGDDSEAHDINVHGHVVGVADDGEGTTRAFVWQDDQMVNLGLLSGSFGFSRAYGINDDGLVVGLSSGDGFPFFHATVWIDGEPVDLNDVIEPAIDWELWEATDINNTGLCYGFRDELPRAFLLTPMPPPPIPVTSEWGLVVMGLLILAGGTLVLTKQRSPSTA
jgi:probable HAF family extracellular repeat protein